MSLESLNLSPQKEKQLYSKKINTIRDLLYYFPIGYRDYRQETPIHLLEDGQYAVIYGEVILKDVSSNHRYVVHLQCENMQFFTINWFGGGYYFDQVEKGEHYYFCGKITSFGFPLPKQCMNNPEVFTKDKKELSIYPRYSKIRGMSREFLINTITKAFDTDEAYELFKGDCELKQSLIDHLNIMPLQKTLYQMHFPSDEKAFKGAKRRLAFDILYEFYINLFMDPSEGAVFDVDINKINKTKEFVKELPFPLTKDQASAIDHFKAKALQKEAIQGLILGDVGSGKTVVATAMAMLMVENSYQVALLSPTQVLATQNYHVLKDYLSDYGVEVALLTSAIKVKERRAILKGVKEGSIHVLVGTHSLLSDEIEFCNLGLSVIDEEHRFGVDQKTKLKEKYQTGIHALSMSATPIPRSLALSVFGQTTEIMPIKTKPAGRLKIETKKIEDYKIAYNKIDEEIKKGRQAYIICPLINESESETFQDVDSVESVYEEAVAFFKGKPHVRIGQITGKMKPAQVEKTLKAFSEHELDILVSTTIVEVGVNVPNASVIAIHSAERFGLAQLHQLRGRVGRGQWQSYCYVVSDKETQRLQVLEDTDDGFEIAEEDFKLRGAGSLGGIIQTGYSEEVETILKYPKLAHGIQKLISAKKSTIR